MAISLTKYVQELLGAGDEWKRVSSLADELLRPLSTGDAQVYMHVTQPGMGGCRKSSTV